MVRVSVTTGTCDAVVNRVKAYNVNDKMFVNIPSAIDVPIAQSCKLIIAHMQVSYDTGYN
jgi:aspartate carbamoyltransferase regulatory subunit